VKGPFTGGAPYTNTGKASLRFTFTTRKS